MKDEKIDMVVDGLLDSCKTDPKKSKKVKSKKTESKLNEEANPFELYEPDDDASADKKKQQAADLKVATADIKKAISDAAKIVKAAVRKHKKVGATDTASLNEIMDYLIGAIRN